MEKVAIDEVENEPNPLDVHTVRRPVGRVLGLSDFALNYFELEPGESFSGGMHTHHDQEEVFYVQEGAATFDTPDDEIVVESGELIRFAPGEFQTGYNDGDDRVVGFAFGAPGAMHDWSDLESLVHCRECGEETGHLTTLTEAGAFRLTCQACENEFRIG
ncbi:cupin domain-containing protein [Halovivax sp.]|uniref:cupin domain-containing protein n=1 Tax=Halovivax sp. TaxID=1935978 RepID=UPI0025C63B00|nr:cupin domain-containing protein [Halovivax sp.]